jgi:hypothetical protein
MIPLNMPDELPTSRTTLNAVSIMLANLASDFLFHLILRKRGQVTISVYCPGAEPNMMALTDMLAIGETLTGLTGCPTVPLQACCSDSRIQANRIVCTGSCKPFT